MVAGDLPGALHLARASLRSAERAGDPGLMAHSLARIAVFEFLHGNGVRLDLLDEAEALAVSAGEEPIGRLSLHSPLLVKGLIFKWCDRLGEARAVMADQYRNALDRGDEASLPFLLYNFSELECWAGNWDAAEQYALEGCRVAEESRQQAMRPATLYPLAFVRACRGQVTEARELAAEGLALCEQTGNVPLAAQLLSVLGFAAVSVGDYQGAVSHLEARFRGDGRLRPRRAGSRQVPPRRYRSARHPRPRRSCAAARTPARGARGIARTRLGTGDGRALPGPPRRC